MAYRCSKFASRTGLGILGVELAFGVELLEIRPDTLLRLVVGVQLFQEGRSSAYGVSASNGMEDVEGVLRPLELGERDQLRALLA